MKNKILSITDFPNFIEINDNIKENLKEIFFSKKNEISEFTVTSLILHQKLYNYYISKLDNIYVILGCKKNVISFFCIPIDIPTIQQIKKIFSFLDNKKIVLNHTKHITLDFEFAAAPLQNAAAPIPTTTAAAPLQNATAPLQNTAAPIPNTIPFFSTDPNHQIFWKNMSEIQYQTLHESLSKESFIVNLDTNNCDYVYYRNDLQNLSGKKYHKKKNLVNYFKNSFTIKLLPLSQNTIKDAKFILENWYKNWSVDNICNLFSDYEICKNALNMFLSDNNELTGFILYADESPCAFSIGETLTQNDTYCVHFEKAINDYKGVFQTINQLTAQNLDPNIIFINREQDLGDSGLRQAKLTYKPCKMINKYTVHRTNNDNMII